MIGILRWAVELGRINIIIEVTLLSSFNTSPREGHLEAAYQIFEYLYAHKNGAWVVYDSDFPADSLEDRFEEVDWSKIYGDINEDIPENTPKLRGNVVRLTMFCDAAFAGDKKRHNDHTRE